MVLTQCEPNHILCSAAIAFSGDAVEGGARISVLFTYVQIITFIATMDLTYEPSGVRPFGSRLT